MDPEQYLFNAIRLYDLADSCSCPELLRLAYIDTAEGLAKLSEHELSTPVNPFAGGGVNSLDASSLNYPLYPGWEFIEKYLKVLENRGTLSPKLREQLHTCYKPRNRVVHGMHMPSKPAMEAFIRSLIQLLSQVGRIPTEYSTRSLDEALMDTLTSRELGISVPCPTAWSLKEAKNFVRFYSGGASIWLRVWAEAQVAEVVDKIEMHLGDVTWTAKELESGIPVFHAVDTAGLIRVVLTEIIAGNLFYEFQYDPGPGRYDIYAGLFNKILRGFKPLAEGPLLSHEHITTIIAQAEFPRPGAFVVRRSQQSRFGSTGGPVKVDLTLLNERGIQPKDEEVVYPDIVLHSPSSEILAIGEVAIDSEPTIAKLQTWKRCARLCDDFRLYLPASFSYPIERIRHLIGGKQVVRYRYVRQTKEVKVERGESQ